MAVPNFALKLGHEAHQVTPLNFRPCTLLGAVYISTGEFSIGHEWYEKARERGFSQSAYDNDIRSIYLRANKEMKKRLKQNLIQTGHKYNWLWCVMLWLSNIGHNFVVAN